MIDTVAFPITVSFGNGESESYIDHQDLECNLEHFDSERSPECKVVDAAGRRVVLKLELLQLLELRLAAP